MYWTEVRSRGVLRSLYCINNFSHKENTSCLDWYVWIWIFTLYEFAAVEEKKERTPRYTLTLP